jgi:hypothetical protein
MDWTQLQHLLQKLPNRRGMTKYRMMLAFSVKKSYFMTFYHTILPANRYKQLNFAIFDFGTFLTLSKNEFFKITIFSILK